MKSLYAEDFMAAAGFQRCGNWPECLRYVEASVYVDELCEDCLAEAMALPEKPHQG